MNSVERVKKMCKERKIPISKLERDLGFSNGYIGQLRKGVFPDDRLRKISEYFGVSLEYLATGDDSASRNDELKAKGERIKARRKELGISAEQLADVLGVSPATIYRYESNYINSMKVDKIKPIADALNTSVAYLMGWDEAPANDSASKKDGLTAKDERDIKQAIEDFKNRLSTAGVMYDGEPLDEESQAAVLAAVELAERTARIAAKEKFTPKKYKK